VSCALNYISTCFVVPWFFFIKFIYIRDFIFTGVVGLVITRIYTTRKISKVW
jgi:hypothetical protein